MGDCSDAAKTSRPLTYTIQQPPTVPKNRPVPKKISTSETEYTDDPLYLEAFAMEGFMGLVQIPKATAVHEEISARHRREKKELQAQIQQLKKGVNKDKKKKKEISEEIDLLEKQLNDRHMREIADVLPQREKSLESIENGTAVCAESMNRVDFVNGENEENEVTTIPQQEKRVSRADKRRQKKSELNRELEAKIKESEISNRNSARSLETGKLGQILKERKLKMFDIAADGNCMYAAIAHQIDDEATPESLRSEASKFMLEHADDFAPFLTDADTGDMLTPEQFAKYCRDVESTLAWGGQPELRALSQTLRRKIEVLQAEGSPIVFGDEFCDSDRNILLAYYRHYYRLGEHYNSVVPSVSCNEKLE